MRSQLDRDEVTVTIATTVALVLVLLVTGFVVIALLDWRTDLSHTVVRTLLVCLAAAAVWVSGSYLWRHRRP